MDILRSHGDFIIQKSIAAVLPDAAVKAALQGKAFPGKVLLLAVGKAGWQMAKAAWDCLGGKIHGGMVITKYGHVMGQIGNLTCYEAGHPIPDENSFRATAEAIHMVQDLRPEDTVLFLLSGGGSALFETPLIPPAQLQDITDQLLRCGADIVQINTIRKRLSGVKGGKFAKLCQPARVESVVLSDILGDPLDMIASGPAWPDTATCDQALEIVKHYGLTLSEEALACLRQETPKKLENVSAQITGSVRTLCKAAVDACMELGYETVLLTDGLCCEAKQAGAELAEHLQKNRDSKKPLAFVAGGETVVKLTGKGKGGRNQELALSAAMGIAGLAGAAVFSIGSDGTDGPTDAAGGYVDSTTAGKLLAMGMDIGQVLRDNDAYHALEKTGGLIITGPTGTNVNDVAVALLRR